MTTLLLIAPLLQGPLRRRHVADGLDGFRGALTVFPDEPILRPIVPFLLQPHALQMLCHLLCQPDCMGSP